MSNFMYSIKTKGFYPSDKEAQRTYLDAGTLPDDLLVISDEQYADFLNPPDGFYSVFDENGPRTERIPEADYKAAAQRQRDELLDEASLKITIWQTKLLMGRKLTSDERASLDAWMDFIDAVSTVDIEAAPDIIWPEIPKTL
ncbi:tail fiber assembly protein [Enterobacter cloacae]|nr:tail fiber assembly protein [Enterobacter cloacae]